LIAGNLTKVISGTEYNYPTTVRWSQAFAQTGYPDTWEPTLSNVANEQEVPVRGPLIDGFFLGGNFYVCSYWDTVLFSPIAYAQEAQIIRGPYLQSVTTTSAIVHWRTDKPVSSRVYYQDSKKIVREALDTNRVTEHIVQLNQLKPGTKYAYQIDSKQFVSERYVMTAPGAQKPVRIWALGDFGDGSSSQKAVMESITNYTKGHRPDAWIWLGDNAYNNGKDE
jgi:hypothetical protein